MNFKRRNNRQNNCFYLLSNLLVSGMRKGNYRKINEEKYMENKKKWKIAYRKLIY